MPQDPHVVEMSDLDGNKTWTAARTPVEPATAEETASEPTAEEDGDAPTDAADGDGPHARRRRR